MSARETSDTHTVLIAAAIGALLAIVYVLGALRADVRYLRREVDPNSVPQCFQAEQLAHDVTRSVAVDCPVKP